MKRGKYYDISVTFYVFILLSTLGIENIVNEKFEKYEFEGNAGCLPVLENLECHDFSKHVTEVTESRGFKIRGHGFFGTLVSECIFCFFCMQKIF